jgi:hypothetical protein
MKINKSLSLLLISAKFLLASTEKVTFKVLAINGTPTVNINYQQHPMQPVPNKYPLYSVDVDVKEFPVNYNYIIDYGNGNAEQEEFTRQRSKEDKPLNEFFGRSITVKEHPLLPKAFEEFPYAKKSKLYDDSFVASIFINCDPNQLKELYDNPKDGKINAEVIYASPYDVRTFKKAILSISGQSTMHVPKFSYKIKNLSDENKKELYGRSSIKLRAEHMDPTFVREKIYSDILNTLGVPTAQNTYARLYINGAPIGFFDLSDTVNNNRYLRNTFNNGEKYKNVNNNPNPLYQANSVSGEGLYSDFGFYGDDATQDKYSVYVYKGDDKVKTKYEHIANDLIPLFKEIESYKFGEVNGISIDIDSFLKYMAMEFLGGAVDNFWVTPGNYYLFKDLEKNKWFFHDVDFHYSFGVSWDAKKMLNTPLSEFPPDMEDGNKEKSRPLLDAIRSHPNEEAKFKSIFERLLKTSFHPNALFPRLESLTNLIREDAHWDFTLEKQNPNPTEESDILYVADDFEKESTSEKENEAYAKGVPVRYFIKNKALLTAQELGVTIPFEYESDLGFYENLSMAKEDEKSGSIKSLSWSLLSIIIVSLVTLLL